MIRLWGIVLIVGGGALIGAAPPGRERRVQNTEQFAQALRSARPGDRILLSPGSYRGGIHVANVRGEPGRPVLVAALDPQRPPVIQGGSGLQLTDPAYLELRGLQFVGSSANGLNIDDGGSYETPAHHLTLRDLTIKQVGPSGNRDGIKLSGVDHFRVVGCRLSEWGRGGSGIDMVGCHDGLIESCQFRYGDETGSNAVQAKGGTARITVRRCRFDHAGQRAANLGGSTGLEFFRPRPQGYEAKALTVEGCTFVGSMAPVAFVGVDGAIVRYNTIYRPRRWVMRILQETTAPGFVPCRNGVFSNNLVLFRADEVAETVNIGSNTAPGSFRFERNWWYALDAPRRSAPSLPTAERNGVSGRDPRLRSPESGDMRPQPGSPATSVGAHALPGD